MSADLVPAPQDVALALGVGEGTPTVRRRLRYLDEQGVMTVSTSWLNGALGEAAPELLAAGPLPKVTFGLVEERTGRRAVRRRDTVPWLRSRRNRRNSLRLRPVRSRWS